MKLTVKNLLESLITQCEPCVPDWKSGAFEQYDYESVTYHTMELELTSESDEIRFEIGVEIGCKHDIQTEPPMHDIEVISLTYHLVELYVGETLFHIPTTKPFIELINTKIELI